MWRTNPQVQFHEYGTLTHRIKVDKSANDDDKYAVTILESGVV